MRISVDLKMEWKIFWLLIIILFLLFYIVMASFNFPILTVYNNCTCPVSFKYDSLYKENTPKINFTYYITKTKLYFYNDTYYIIDIV